MDLGYSARFDMKHLLREEPLIAYQVFDGFEPFHSIAFATSTGIPAWRRESRR